MTKQGAFGRVTPSQTPQRVLKIPHSDDPTTKYMRALENEAHILNILTKKKVGCVPKYYGRTTQNQKGYPALQMQYLPIQQADVRTYLTKLSAKEFHDFLMQCFACLEKLHRHVLHMDLHEGNVMFRRPNAEIPYPQLVFIDFGYSVTLEDVLRNYPSPKAAELVELYKRYERYQLYSILVGLYENQQQQQQQKEQSKHVKTIKSIPHVEHTFRLKKEADMADEFHDTCNVMINEGRWRHNIK